jgi:hypothetical protein
MRTIRGKLDYTRLSKLFSHLISCIAVTNYDFRNEFLLTALQKWPRTTLIQLALSFLSLRAGLCLYTFIV